MSCRRTLANSLPLYGAHGTPTRSRQSLHVNGSKRSARRSAKLTCQGRNERRSSGALQSLAEQKPRDRPPWRGRQVSCCFLLVRHGLRAGRDPSAHYRTGGRFEHPEDPELPLRRLVACTNYFSTGHLRRMALTLTTAERTELERRATGRTIRAEHYNDIAKPIRWKACDPTRRITGRTSVSTGY